MTDTNTRISANSGSDGSFWLDEAFKVAEVTINQNCPDNDQRRRALEHLETAALLAAKSYSLRP